jgi:superfamily II DNA or RNA helicase
MNPNFRKPITPPSIKLRDYQVQAVDYARVALRTSEVVSLVAPCAAGKTVMFTDIAWRASEKKFRVMVIVPYQSLLDQFVTTLIYRGFRGSKKQYQMVISSDPDCKNPLTQSIKSEYDRLCRNLGTWQSEIAYYAGSKPSILAIESIKVVVAMAQTIESRGMPDIPIGIICYDESHITYFRRELHQKLSEYSHYRKAKELLLTATPWRGDGAEYPNVQHYQVISTEDLIRKGYNSPFRYFPLGTLERKYAIKQHDLSETKEREVLEKTACPEKAWEMLHYPSQHTQGNTQLGSVFSQQSIFFFGRKAIALTYMEYFQPLLRAEGIDKELILVSDTTPANERAIAFTKFRQGRAILFTITCLAIGFDEPSVENIILLRTFSANAFALFTQILGRGLRVSPGKTECRIYDLCSNPYFPLPNEVTDWTIYQGEKSKTQVPSPVRGKGCNRCGTVCGRAMKFCYKCGNELPKPSDKTPEEEFSELQQIVNAYVQDADGKFNIDDKLLKLLAKTLATINQFVKVNVDYLSTVEVKTQLDKALIGLQKTLNCFIYEKDKLPVDRLRSQSFEFLQLIESLPLQNQPLIVMVSEFRKLVREFLEKGEENESDIFLEELRKSLGTTNVVKFVERISTPNQPPDEIYRIYIKLAVLLYRYAPGWAYYRFKRHYPDLEVQHIWKKHAIFGDKPTYGNYLYYHAYLRSKYGSDTTESNKKVYGSLAAEFGTFNIEFQEQYLLDRQQP